MMENWDGVRSVGLYLPGLRQAFQLQPEVVLSMKVLRSTQHAFTSPSHPYRYAHQ